MKSWQRIVVPLFAAVCAVHAAALRADAPKACAQLSEEECIDSAACTLEHLGAHGKYACREARGRCETGFRQGGGGDIRQACESKPGCTFKPGSCYCPPRLSCFCGGGPPAQCVESNAQKIGR